MKMSRRVQIKRSRLRKNYEENVHFSFAGYDTLCEAICTYACRSRILTISGLVWVSIKIIIAGREAFLSNIKKPVRFRIGCNSQLPSSRRLIYTLPHFVFAWLDASQSLDRRRIDFAFEKKFVLPIKKMIDCLSTIRIIRKTIMYQYTRAIRSL